MIRVVIILSLTNCILRLSMSVLSPPDLTTYIGIIRYVLLDLVETRYERHAATYLYLGTLVLFVINSTNMAIMDIYGVGATQAP
jgi:hypothetical protein